jgi:hypothetical protein
MRKARRQHVLSAGLFSVDPVSDRARVPLRKNVPLRLTAFVGDPSR